MRTQKDRERLRKIGNKLKKARIDRGYSRPRFAKMMGYKSPDSIRLIEIGHMATLDINYIFRACEKLGVSLDEVLSDVN